MTDLQHSSKVSPDVQSGLLLGLRMVNAATLQALYDLVLSDAHRYLGVDCVRLLLLTSEGHQMGRLGPQGHSIHEAQWLAAEALSPGDNARVFKALGLTPPLDLAGRAPAQLHRVQRAGRWMAGVLLLWPPSVSQADEARVQSFLQLLAMALEVALLRQQVAHQSLVDQVTQAFSRQYYLEQAQQEISRALRGGWPVSSIFLDVDFMRHINDAFGSESGDVVLREVVRRANSQLRAGEVVARLGGEEFAVLLVHGTSTVARVVAERIRHAVNGTGVALPTGEVITVSVSCGVADIKPLRAMSVLDSVHQLMRSAEQALLQAKQAGRNRVAVYGGRAHR